MVIRNVRGFGRKTLRNLLTAGVASIILKRDAARSYQQISVSCNNVATVCQRRSLTNTFNSRRVLRYSLLVLDSEERSSTTFPFESCANQMPIGMHIGICFKTLVVGASE